jgi:hypothetical protein
MTLLYIAVLVLSFLILVSKMEVKISPNNLLTGNYQKERFVYLFFWFLKIMSVVGIVWSIYKLIN